MSKSEHNLLILTSTFPRWENDNTPTFVKEFAKKIQDGTLFSSVTVLAPHYYGAKNNETTDGLKIRRFSYWIPRTGQNIVYDGGGLSKKRSSVIYYLKLLSFIVNEYLSSYRTIKKESGVLVNAHWILPQGFVAIILKKTLGVPVVVSIHGSDIFSLNSSLQKRIKSYVLKNADSVVVNSSATKIAAEKLYKRTYAVIPMGVDTTVFTTNKRPVKSDGKIELIYVGRITEVKGVEYIIDAVHKLTRSYESDKLHLSVVGDGPERHQIEEKVKELGIESYISFKGWIGHKELPNVYKKSDIFVGASIEAPDGAKEAYGLVYAEAQASGLPVVATDTGGIKDIVKDGHTGYLVDQKSGSLLANKIKILIEDKALRRTMGQAGVLWATNRLSWSHTTESYTKEFNEVLANRKN